MSLVFSAYLNTVQSTVSNHFDETRNLEVSPVVVEYEGVPVSYQHQLWRVRPELKQSSAGDWRQVKIQNMYCNAAVSFKPTVASIGSAQMLSSLEYARQACNAATVSAMGNSDPRLAREREKACEVYRELKAQHKSSDSEVTPQ